ncbi:unnamed protein product [Cuscuta campestris]|uniref:Uncharacterized protein n=1 Tax=Cuscuta campestris TaxID=132261 RepID=A0A484KH64_9ASTE|nr:unnamed protein product [Cuscuta campestris]
MVPKNYLLDLVLRNSVQYFLYCYLSVEFFSVLSICVHQHHYTKKGTEMCPLVSISPGFSSLNDEWLLYLECYKGVA